jgi:hypothetical protein
LAARLNGARAAETRAEVAVALVMLCRGAKYRALTARAGVIYYQRRVGRKRARFSLGTSDWDEAAKAARYYEARKGIGRLPAPVLKAPTFAELAERYLARGTAGLAPTTLEDRTHLLHPKGMLTAHFGARRIDELRRALAARAWRGAGGPARPPE